MWIARRASDAGSSLCLRFWHGVGLTTWFVTEGSEQDDDFLCFGYVIGLEEEWGYFLISELELARGPLGLSIERDLYFTPGPFSTIIDQYRRERGG